MNTSTGVRTYFLYLRFLRVDGVLWMAVECLTFIFMNRNTFGRSALNPRGYEGSNASVKDANECVTIVSGMIVVSHVGRRTFGVEQPRSSVLNYFDGFSELLAWSGAVTINTPHGAFAGESQKDLKLFGTLPNMHTLVRTPTDEDSRRWVQLTYKVDGRTYGHRDLLSNSEHYTADFGDAVARACSL